MYEYEYPDRCGMDLSGYEYLKCALLVHVLVLLVAHVVLGVEYIPETWYG